MTQVRCVVSSVLLAAGLLLVGGGLAAAFQFSAAGLLASAAAVATLLTAGRVWFAPPEPATSHPGVIVFDRSLRIACGAARGVHVAAQFPLSMRGQIEARCAAALRGEHLHFACEHDGVALGFDAAPVRAADGTVLYGLLITGTAAPASAVAGCTAS